MRSFVTLILASTAVALPLVVTDGTRAGSKSISEQPAVMEEVLHLVPPPSIDQPTERIVAVIPTETVAADERLHELHLDDMWELR